VVVFGASLAFLSFLDRAAISQAAPSIIRELHLSPLQMGLVFSAFGITYAAFEIPSGWLCDRFGARLLLTRVVFLWSIFTAATGWAWSFSSLYITRLLFGAGESGCFPGLARVFKTWLPPNERNSAEGIKAASARWGAAITPALIAALYGHLNWRQVFFLFGAVGVLWGVAFSRWYRDDPRDHSEVNRAELDLLPSRVTGNVGGESVSWKKLIASRSVWALGIQWFCHYYGFYFYITWLPLYLYQARHLNLARGSLAAGLPLFSAGLGSMFAGWATTALTRRVGSTSRARRLMGYTAYGGAAVLLLVFTQFANPVLAMIAMSLSSFAAEFSGPITWTTAMDIGGERVGTVSGFMNMLGHLGGSVAPALTGFLLSVSGNAWNVAFYCSALIYGAGAVCWTLIDPVTPVDVEKG
jgi:ACS family glucarate transporter-like MFS transporter